jgi:hypothetical protein
MSSIYCGNNLAYSGILNGTHRMGTNLQCLRIGIGKGKSLPADPKFAEDYNPFDKRTYYCGNEEEIPQGSTHFAMGSPSKCLSTGIGIGKKKKAVETFQQNNQGGNRRSPPQANFGIINEEEKQELSQENHSIKSNQNIYYLVLGFIFVMVFIILYTIKPSFVQADILKILEREKEVKNGVLVDDVDENINIQDNYKRLSPKMIDWYSFTIYFLGISLLLGLIFSIIFKKYIINRIN